MAACSMINIRAASSSAGRVTVLMPVYNGAATIRRALDSVLGQTMPAQQVLVIDDGSTDDTVTRIAGEYEGAVTLVRQSNAGVSSARNRGLRLATGEYIAMLDADDWWAPGKIASQVALLDEQPDVVATYTGLINVFEETGREEPAAAFPAEKLQSQIRLENPALAPSAMMVRRSALEAAGGFDASLRTSEDWDLWFRLLKHGRFAEIKEPLTYYQCSSHGISGDAATMFRSFEAIREMRLLDGLSGIDRALWRRRITSFQAFKACLTARGAGDRPTERHFMWRSLREWPSPFWYPRRFKYFAVTLLRS